MECLFLEGPEETFGHTVGFGLAEKGEARRYAPKLDLVLEVDGLERVAVVVAECKPRETPAATVPNTVLIAMPTTCAAA